MFKINLISVLLLIGATTNVFPQTDSLFPAFEEHKVPIFEGKIKPPKWIRWIRGDEWRDNLGKLSEPPDINFAGNYFISLHSCGTGCRYYTLTNLINGKDLNVLTGFGSGEVPPTTKEGYVYRERLSFVPESNLIVVQYDVENPSGTQCRERSFILKNDKLTAITPTVYRCRSLE